MTGHAVAHQVRYEQRTYWRNPAGVFFTIGLPVLMLSIFTTLNEGDFDAGTGRSFGADFVPGMLTFGVVSAAYGNVAARLVVRRESGLLKRARAAPVGPGPLVAGMVVNALIVTTVVGATVLTVGRLFYDVALPVDWPLAVLVLGVGATSFAALGLAMGSFVPNVDAADPMAFGTILPLLFISGVFTAVPDGSMLDRIADVFPAKHLFLAALHASGSDDPNPYGHLLVVAAWGVVGAVVAVRRFRWEPSR